MNKDQGIGAVLLVATIIGIPVYAWLLFAYAIVVLQITAFIAVASVLVIAAWIGWTMATTPPSAPLEPEPVATSSISDSTSLEKTQS
jgi:predicted DNA-binding transcriptional regulator